jgi:diguanylate cyclase (GGDEF)-like protein
MNPAFEATRSFEAPALPGSSLLGLFLAWFQQPRAALKDRHTGLFNRGGLMDAANKMLAKARAEARPLSILVIEFNDLREVHEIYGSSVGRKLVAKVVNRLTALAGSHGLVGRTGSAQFTIVLPMPREKALLAVQRVLGSPARIEFEAGDSEIVLVPEMMLDCTDAETESMAALWREDCLDLSRMQAREQRRQNHLQRERERHSRPMAFTSSRH